MPLTDDTVMKFGKFKGDILEDVPAWWLIWIEKKILKEKKQGAISSFKQGLLDYIEENRDEIELELKEER